VILTPWLCCLKGGCEKEIAKGFCYFLKLKGKKAGNDFHPGFFTFFHAISSCWYFVFQPEK
jgi:hypothetical protein